MAAFTGKELEIDPWTPRGIEARGTAVGPDRP
jgi:hypothetical protein